MSAAIHRFRRKPHALIERGTEPNDPSGEVHFIVWLVDDRGLHQDIWSGWGATNALAEAIYLECPIFLRLGAFAGDPA